MTVSSLHKNTSATESPRFAPRDVREAAQRVATHSDRLESKRQQRSSIVCRLGTVNLNDV